MSNQLVFDNKIIINDILMPIDHRVHHVAAFQKKNHCAVANRLNPAYSVKIPAIPKLKFLTLAIIKNDTMHHNR